MVKHPWHEVETGAKAPELVNAFIEIPKGSKAKYEIDKTSGLLKLDRVLFSSMHYPAHYGFIPQTLCGDRDPLDILVICSVDIVPYCLLEARVIGVMRMKDQGDLDDKIIAVAHKDVGMDYIQDIKDLPPHTMIEITRFFQDYKTLENKTIEVEPILGKEDAMTIIRDNISAYKAAFPKS